MDDLVQFLRARLDEDEQAARACPGDGNWSDAGLKFYAPDLSDEVRTHAARHDPARVLTEIDAKRSLLELAERARDYHETFVNGFAAALENTLRLHAVAYTDHPDYRDTWRL